MVTLIADRSPDNLPIRSPKQDFSRTVSSLSYSISLQRLLCMTLDVTSWASDGCLVAVFLLFWKILLSKIAYGVGISNI
jgi:hypothetical protein